MRGVRGIRVPLAALAVTMVVVAAAAIGAGGKEPRVVRGSLQADVLRGSAHADRIYGFAGKDRLIGGAGADTLSGGPGTDTLRGGKGDDRIHARDGQRDIVSCGPGKDQVAVDWRDRVARDCERRDLDPKRLPKEPAPTATPVKAPPPSGPTRKLTVRVTGSGLVRSRPNGIDCPAQCRAYLTEGSVVQLTAVPAPGQQFRGWGAQCRGTAPTCTTTLSRDKWVGATFSGAASTPSPPPPSSSPPPPSLPPSGNSVVRVNEGWVCRGPVNLDLVRVTMESGSGDAIHLREGCTGRIGRVEVSTWVADGIKVNAPAPAAHDLVIEGGFVRCFDNRGGGHQDGIQVMGGERITFRNLEVNCATQPNAQLFIAASNGGHPTDVVCESCVLGASAAQTLFIATSMRSGARNSVICDGRFNAIRIEGASPVNVANVVVPSTDPRCQP